MQAFIEASLLSSDIAQPREKPFEIYDRRLPGFTMRAAQRRTVVLCALRAQSSRCPGYGR